MSLLVEAAQQPTIKFAAVAYALAGLSIIPLRGKKPSAGIYWASYQTKPATPNQIARWENQGLLHNVGIVCGKVSRGLLVIDCDGLNAVDAFEKRFPDLLDTFTVLTGSGKGKHYYYAVRELPHSTIHNPVPGGGQIELRGDGCYVVAPPSIHPDTNLPYRIDRPLPVKRLDNLDKVESWVVSLKPKPVPQKPIQRAIRGGSTDARRYAVGALHSAAKAVRTAAADSRNDTLNKEAMSMARFVKAGALSRWEVEQELLAAYQAAKANSGESGEFIEREGRNTINSGIEAGFRKPRG